MWERVLTIGSILLELLLHTSLTGMDDDMMVLIEMKKTITNYIYFFIVKHQGLGYWRRGVQ